MKEANDKDIERKILILIKYDADNLYHRLKTKRKEYMAIFSLKRSRDHFKEIFLSKYWGISFRDFLHLSEELIIAVENFYHEIDELRWYIEHTEDMPNTVEDNLIQHLKKLDKYYDILTLYIESELRYDDEKIDDGPV